MAWSLLTLNMRHEECIFDFSTLDSAELVPLHSFQINTGVMTIEIESDINREGASQCISLFFFFTLSLVF